MKNLEKIMLLTTKKKCKIFSKQIRLKLDVKINKLKLYSSIIVELVCNVHLLVL